MFWWIIYICPGLSAPPAFIVVCTCSSSVVTVLHSYVLHITWIYTGRWFFGIKAMGKLYRHSGCAVRSPLAIFIELGFAHRVRAETYSLNENHCSFHKVEHIRTNRIPVFWEFYIICIIREMFGHIMGLSIMSSSSFACLRVYKTDFFITNKV